MKKLRRLFTSGFLFTITFLLVEILVVVFFELGLDTIIFGQIIARRPEALDAACFVLAGIDEKNLLQAVEVAILNKEGCKPVDVYVDTNVSDKVVKIVQSYVGVVNKMVWRKE